MPERGAGRRALVVGVTGISGRSLVERLLAEGWAMSGVSRRATRDLEGVEHVAVDVADASATRAALAGTDPTHAFFCTWARHETELQEQMADAGPVWEEIVARHGLRAHRLEELASWWHSDADVSRTLERFTDMGKSRRFGFLEHQPTDRSFLDLFERLRAQRIIPSLGARAAVGSEHQRPVEVHS
jgi:NAD(P)-dependent dehydrogenase (short-subunit alcohol dehydrogenase family)